MTPSINGVGFVTKKISKVATFVINKESTILRNY